MGFRFRKSVKIAPGVKLNFGKKSAGVSIGNKYEGININSKTGASSRISAPGTGLSYTSKLSSSGKHPTPQKAGSSTQSHSSDDFQDIDGELTLFLDAQALQSLNLDALTSYYELVNAHAEKIQVGDDAAYAKSIQHELSLLGEEFRRRTDKIKKSKKPLYRRPWFLILIGILAIGTIGKIVSPDKDAVSAEAPPVIESPVASTPTSVPSEDTTEAEIIAMLAPLIPEENIKVRAVNDSTEITAFTSDLAQADSREKLKTALLTLAPTLPLLPDTTQSVLYISQTDGGTIFYTIANGRLLFDAVESQANQEASEKPSEAMVYVSATGSKYHYDPDCSGMNSPRQVTISEARNMGLTACKKCG